MNWGSLRDFVAMGGYGPYVWGAYLVALAAVIVEVALLAVRRRNILRHLGAARTEESSASALEPNGPAGTAGEA